MCLAQGGKFKLSVWIVQNVWTPCMPCMPCNGYKSCYVTTSTCSNISLYLYMSVSLLAFDWLKPGKYFYCCKLNNLRHYMIMRENFENFIPLYTSYGWHSLLWYNRIYNWTNVQAVHGQLNNYLIIVVIKPLYELWPWKSGHLLLFLNWVIHHEFMYKIWMHNYCGKRLTLIYNTLQSWVKIKYKINKNK